MLAMLDTASHLGGAAPEADWPKDRWRNLDRYRRGDASLPFEATDTVIIAASGPLRNVSFYVVALLFQHIEDITVERVACFFSVVRGKTELGSG
jgi:hypothetical protein